MGNTVICRTYVMSTIILVFHLCMCTCTGASKNSWSSIVYVYKKSNLVWPHPFLYGALFVSKLCILLIVQLKTDLIFLATKYHVDFCTSSKISGWFFHNIISRRFLYKFQNNGSIFSQHNIESIFVQAVAKYQVDFLATKWRVDFLATKLRVNFWQQSIQSNFWTSCKISNSVSFSATLNSLHLVTPVVAVTEIPLIYNYMPIQ